MFYVLLHFQNSTVRLFQQKYLFYFYFIQVFGHITSDTRPPSTVEIDGEELEEYYLLPAVDSDGEALKTEEELEEEAEEKDEEWKKGDEWYEERQVREKILLGG